MFNSVLSSVGLSIGANTSNTTSFLSDTASSSPDAKTVVVTLFLGVLVGLLISLLYIVTHRKNGYSQSYVMTLLILPPIVAIVLSMINSTASDVEFGRRVHALSVSNDSGRPERYYICILCNGGWCDLRH